MITDAIPSIFPWDSDTDEEMEDITGPVEGFSKDCEIENVDAIKKFIEAQEKEIQELKDADIQNADKRNDPEVSKPTPEPLCVASSMIDMILDKSVLEIAQKKGVVSKEILSTVDKGKKIIIIIYAQIRSNICLNHFMVDYIKILYLL